MTWASTANVNARIEAHRKGDFTVSFLDAESGALLPPGSVTSFSAALARHDFAFGTAYDPRQAAVADQPW
jgi:ethanolamine utilization microcompartment shell protein EutS